MEKKFEKATRMKVRFVTNKGVVSVEDLWDMSLADLNRLAKALNKEIKGAEEEDFLGDTSPTDTKLKLRFDIVVYILGVKKEEKEKRDQAKTMKEEKEKLLRILERKQNESLEELSEEDLRKRIEELG